MQIVTKFNIGELVKKSGEIDVAEIKDVVVQAYGDDEPLITYDLIYAVENNVHIQKDFHGNAFESELEAVSPAQLASLQKHQAKL